MVSMTCFLLLISYDACLVAQNISNRKSWNIWIGRDTSEIRMVCKTKKGQDDFDVRDCKFAGGLTFDRYLVGGFHVASFHVRSDTLIEFPIRIANVLSN